MRIYSHLEHQLANYQANAVLGEYGFSHLEARNTNRTFCTGGADFQVCEYTHTWNTNLLIIKRMLFYVRPGRTGLLLFHRTENVDEAFACTEYTGAHWYRKRASGVPNGQKDAVGTGKALLVYQRGQDISFEPVEGKCGRTVGVIPDSHPSTLGAALSFQIQTTIISGEKMVVIHPGRHH